MNHIFHLKLEIALAMNMNIFKMHIFKILYK